MGMVVMTYKINPDSDVEDVDAEAIATTISAMGDDVYNIQSVEVKPLAFGLKFVQVHIPALWANLFQIWVESSTSGELISKLRSRISSKMYF